MKRPNRTRPIRRLKEKLAFAIGFCGAVDGLVWAVGFFARDVDQYGARDGLEGE